MLESTFKTKLIKELKALFPGCMVFHLDPSDGQGIPDLLILFGKKWALARFYTSKVGLKNLLKSMKNL